MIVLLHIKTVNLTNWAALIFVKEKYRAVITGHYFEKIFSRACIYILVVKMKARLE